MTKKTIVEERLIASARQALAIKRGELAPANAYDLPLTARDTTAEEAPTFTKDMIARIREKLGYSQAVFAKALNVSLGTVRSWEQGVRYPDGAANRLLQVADNNPHILELYVHGTVKAPQRGAGFVKRKDARAGKSTKPGNARTRHAPKK